MNGEILAFILYFIMIIGVGFYFFLKDRHSTDEQDYFIGGRAMGPWVTAMSAQASDMSAWLLMGLPGSIMAFGFGQMWIGIGLALGTAANWIFVATRLRKFSKAAGDAITVPQYLSNRFATKSHTLQIICAIIFFACFTVYVASGFVAGASVFTAVFPSLSTSTAMIVFALAMLACTFFGGFKAVCWTDFFQAILMLAAVLAVPIVIAATMEMDTAALSAVYSYTDGASGAVTECSFGSGLFDASWKEIVSGLGWGLGYFGMPHILVRFMSIEKPSMVKKSATVAIVWVILTLGAAAVIAILGRTYLLSDGTSLAALLLPGNQQNIFIVIVEDMFPGFIAGLLLAAIVAAAMSTADSQLLVASSAFTSDIYKPIIRKGQTTDKEITFVSRLVVVIVSIVAYFIAASGSDWASSIMAMVENAWGLFGAAFGPVVLLSLFWKRFNYAGAVAGVIAGALVDILWLIFLTGSTGIYEILPGFIAGGIAAVVVSLMTKAPGAEVEAIFAAATNPDVDD